MSFQEIPTPGARADPDIAYYNAVVVNSSVQTTQTVNDPAAVFQDTRQAPSIRDTSRYMVAVQNFTMNGATKNLPVFIPQINPQYISRTVTDVVVTSQYITYTVNTMLFETNLATGLYVETIQGLTPSSLNFSVKQQVLATPTIYSFTIANTINAPVGTYSALTGTATYQDPSDINRTIYSISFSIFDGTTYFSSNQLVIWEPENVASYTEIPFSCLPVQAESDYYYCYTYTHWVALVNKALRLAWQTCVDDSGDFGTQCPFFEFDCNTGLFSLSQDAKTSMCPVGVALPAPYSVTFAPTGAYNAGEFSFVGMNSNMEGLLTNFNSTFFGPTKTIKSIGAAPDLPEVVLDFGLTNLDNSNTTTGDNAVGTALRTVNGPSSFALQNPFTLADEASTFVRMTQDYVSTGSLWSPIASFVFVTSQIPVRTEDNAPPITLGASNTGSGPAKNAFQKVLIEVPINAITADLWRGFVLYEPLVPTFSSLDPVHDGLTQLDVSVFWRNRLTNSLIPIRLYNEGTLSFRLQFRRKGMTF